MQQRRRRDRSAPFRWTHLIAVLAAVPLWTSTCPAAWAQAPAATTESAVEGPTDGPSATEVAARSALVRSLETHVAVLTSPFFEGRTPGTDGSRRAKEYAEFFLRQSGLEPAFSGSFRQDFDIAGPTRVARQSLRVGDVELVGAREFTGLGLGQSGAVSGELVFAGYAIQEGPEEYRGFPDEVDLTGKVAMVLRFEPRNARGMSRWTENGEWSRRAALLSKVRACVQRGAAAVLVVNPPGAADARARRLMDPGDGGRGGSQVPVLHLTADAGKRLVEGLGRDFVALAARADEAGVVEPLGAVAELDLELERTRVPTQNLGALLPGTGALADQLVVLGAHLDHVGNGSFGSPEDGGTLHPGADDNASGSASLLALVAEFSARAGNFDPAVPRRSILFLLFDAEESGLLGSKHYVGAPVRPIETHSLMINLDMVGRIEGGRVSLQGARSAEGLDVWLEPWLASSGLAIEHSRSVSARSDHASFLDAKVSSLFFTNADGHPDYHRPTDTAEKIATESMADLVGLVADVAEAAAFRSETFVHVPTETASQAR